VALSKGAKFGFAAAPFALVGALLVALNTSEGRRYEAYLDSAGIPTVCRGITGADVVWGKVYTPQECDVLEVRYIDRMLANMGKCVNVELEFNQVKAWGHFAYNIGTPAFCASTAARLINQGQHAAACQQIPRWRFITLPGGTRFDCSTPGNKICAGLWDRRKWELALCQT
jgi:lysozyme